jgi:D-amino-acid dehydrogenase
MKSLFSSAAALPPKKPALPMPVWSRPGYVTPWAAPGMPRKVLGHLMSRHAPVKLGCLGASELAWMWRWWRACKLETYLANRARMQRLAFYSRQRLHQVTAD